ncbi:MAG: MMPL family transporter [Steroidobacterales bacterium]
MESRTGAELVSRLGNHNSALTVRILVRSSDAEPVLAAAHLPALEAYVGRLRADRRVTAVVSPLATGQPGDAAIRALYLSRDGHAALIEARPDEGLSVEAIQALARDLAGTRPAGPLAITVGGMPAYYNDFHDTMWSSFPKVFGFVIAATLLLLFVAFRSYLLPLKAVVANLLAIAAGYGVVIAIFQFGWLHGLLGLERPFTSIALEIPLMIFCMSFGLSMDYELFLLFRIQREFLEHGDNDRATVAGLAAVAPVITGAGLVMAAVFGAFAGADLPVLKMIGVGLCVAVFVDATLIRGFVVPAVMSIAGRWNWYPGIRRGPG